MIDNLKITGGVVEKIAWYKYLYLWLYKRGISIDYDESNGRVVVTNYKHLFGRVIKISDVYFKFPKEKS